MCLDHHRRGVASEHPSVRCRTWCFQQLDVSTSIPNFCWYLLTYLIAGTTLCKFTQHFEMLDCERPLITCCKSVGQVTPDMLTSITYGTYILFGLLTYLGAAFIWFFVPETKRLSLEEMVSSYPLPNFHQLHGGLPAKSRCVWFPDISRRTLSSALKGPPLPTLSVWRRSTPRLV